MHYCLNQLSDRHVSLLIDALEEVRNNLDTDWDAWEEDHGNDVAEDLEMLQNKLIRTCRDRQRGNDG
jgi:hypothetical protein